MATKIGIIGMGRIGNVHYKNLKQMSGITIEYICDIKADDTWEEKYPEAGKVVTDYHEVLESSDVEAVLICVPTNLHPSFIIDAANAGKAIFCEKPVGFNNEDILKAYKVVKDTGVVFQVGFNRRFDDSFDRIVDYRDAGNLGQPQVLKITSRDPEPPSLDYVKVSGGIFMDMTIHDFDMARFISGQEVESLHVFGNVLIEPEIKQYNDIDTAIITLKFKNGMLGVIDNSRKAVYGYDQRIELFGSEGMAHADNVLDSQTTYASKNGVVGDKPMWFFLQRYMKAYAKETKSFFEAVHGEHDVECTFEDGIRAIRLAEAAKESLKTGNEVKVKDIF
ncbi:inositol 2-dehydrogenase [Ligilactobacillus sp. WILCCON 0076]|uniref:Inositol 2-dehydrogenase n=1 Tax=Ligilactobacillus ubinensis TaxID=2876789 RepID=A0A9X2FLS7_9LACO|nr:inositol 2-dehydrogenase [Ligilactobacillus ubinensis]MCP0888067.1 inositol 2-dehydrogenase [Ligilactobacillus ubinensis]